MIGCNVKDQNDRCCPRKERNEYPSRFLNLALTDYPNALNLSCLCFTAARSSSSFQEPEVISHATSIQSGVAPSGSTSSNASIRVNPSRKATETDDNGRAAMAVYWGAVHPRVRVVERIEIVEKEGSEEYFRGRPVGSWVGARASPKSKVVGGEFARVAELGERLGEYGHLKEDMDVLFSEYGGGYRIVVGYVFSESLHDLLVHERIHCSEVEF